jgi:hypothetical protein
VLPGDFGHLFFQIIVLDLHMFAPRCEVAHFSIKAVVGKTALGLDAVDVLVGYDNPSIVSAVAVSHSHADIDEHALAYWILDDVGQHFPAVEEGVTLQVVVECTISCSPLVDLLCNMKW